MAWSIPTYAGEYALGSPSKLRVGLFELCRAVNEREAAMGWQDPGSGYGGGYGNLTRFFKADGTTGVNLTMDDLYKIPCTGAGFENLAAMNMKFITGFVRNFEKFTVGATTTPYTEATFEAAIGTTIDNPVRYNEARWWQSMQDALDLLRFPWAYMPWDAFLNSGSSIKYSDHEDTIGIAWANRDANTLSSGAECGAYARAQPVGKWVASYKLSKNFGFVHNYLLFHSGFGYDFFAPVDTIHSTIVQYSSTVDRLAGSVDFDIDGNTISVSSAVANVDLAVSPFSFTSDNYVSVLLDTPSSSPFEDESSFFGDTGDRNAFVELERNARVYWDITAELTDQA